MRASYAYGYSVHILYPSGPQSVFLHNWGTAQLKRLGTTDIHYFNYLEGWLKLKKIFERGRDVLCNERVARNIKYQLYATLNFKHLTLII